MAIPRYRVIEEKGCYAPRSPEPQVLALGADHASAAVYNIRAPVFEHLKEGTEFEFAGTPGPHLAPLNREAEEAMAKYWTDNPDATLDPTRRMPLGQDPMGGRSVEQLVNGLLEQMGQDAAKQSAARQPGGDMAALLAAVRSMADGQAAMQAAMTALLTAQHPLITATPRKAA
jgi:hypothetical protein